MTVIDIGALSIEELEQLRDVVNRRILEMRRTSGLAMPDLLRLLEEVKATLRDQGKEWYSLERWQWMDGEVRFWLNPKDQVSYRTGWFTIDDLIAWSHERGAVVVDDEYDEEAADEVENRMTTTVGGVTITWLPRSEERRSRDHLDDEFFRRSS